jgi:NADH:ubiquinone oxidoreductase subunit 3 (subunit A)
MLVVFVAMVVTMIAFVLMRTPIMFAIRRDDASRRQPHESGQDGHLDQTMEFAHELARPWGFAWILPA